jgi:hypothetical protein
MTCGQMGRIEKMLYPVLTQKDVSIKYLKNVEYGYTSPIISTAINNERYVMAKSVVRFVIEKKYKYGKDPYINRIERLLSREVTYFEIKDKNILLKVWDKAGNFPSIIFVKLNTLLPILNEVFPDLSEDNINYIEEQLQSTN